MFLPWHFHIDLHRTDQFVRLLRDFVSSAPDGQIYSSGADVDSCFTNMPHELMRTAWRFAWQRIAQSGSFLAISAPRRSRTCICARSFEKSHVHGDGALMISEIVHIEAFIAHELALGWFKFGLKMSIQR